MSATADLQTSPKDVTPMNYNDLPNRSTTMNLMHEDLARAAMDARLEQARTRQRSHRLTRVSRLTRRAERASQQARLLLARNL
jgi:hypothetical protein